jgi:hypothetical protein
LKSGGNLIGSGGCLCCDSLERSDFSFIGSGVVEQAVVETDQSSYSKSTEQNVSDSCSCSKIQVLTVFLRFGHWLTIRDVIYFPPKVMVLQRRLSCR